MSPDRVWPLRRPAAAVPMRSSKNSRRCVSIIGFPPDLRMPCHVRDAEPFCVPLYALEQLNLGITAAIGSHTQATSLFEIIQRDPVLGIARAGARRLAGLCGIGCGEHGPLERL